MADAASIKPKIVPDEDLRTRDNSGGPDFKPHSGDWGEGGRITGPKSHLSATSKGK